MLFMILYLVKVDKVDLTKQWRASLGITGARRLELVVEQTNLVFLRVPVVLSLLSCCPHLGRNC